MPVDVTDEIGAAVRVLARHRIRAVILVDPPVVVEGGRVLDAKVDGTLLVAIFVPEHVNRLHRGAVVIHGDRIALAGVPLSWAEVTERAAELAAGIAVAVDDTTGEIGIADWTGRVEIVEPADLTGLLRRHAREVVPR